ncbi:LPS assembly lipoprotein LptE [Candidatus Albibeggiatoa sp. nov. NOAA]|uniref:LPS-assembly lipoprotein LptE n=1 Tax=Candidatus Albibeggiatoa sp. nov. NOAA TaxID=3162724 RepID=UPI003300EE96|nr:LPS assembly lipoprotein LptE [Thiotrichaceae bacterium]
MIKPLRLHHVRTMKKIFLLSCLVLFLASCGFQLRGSMSYGIENVYIQSEAADILASQVKQYLTGQSNITVVTSPKKADIIVSLSNQKLERRVLTISAVSGRLEEIELNFQATVEMRQPDDTILLEEQKLTYIRDYSFNEKAVLAMGAEEETLRRELLQEASLQVLRMLQIVSNQVQPKTQKNSDK